MIDVMEKLGKAKRDLAGVVGLERRRSMMDYVWPALVILAAGVVVGASLGLLFARKSGRELRTSGTRQPRSAAGSAGRQPRSVGRPTAGARGSERATSLSWTRSRQERMGSAEARRHET